MTKWIVAVALVLVVARAHAEDDPGLSAGSWPESARKAIPHVIARLTAEQREQIRLMKKEDLILLHHSWGMDLRNYLGLWRGNNRLREALCGIGCHRDDASTILMEETWEVLQSSIRR